MNKSQLVAKMAADADISNAAAGRALNALLGAITETLKSDEQVLLLGFGSFLVKNRAGRNGINPNTGEKLQIPAKKVPSFKPASKLKSDVSGGGTNL